MALTMTRTRTQRALTKLVQLTAEVHGELAFVERSLEKRPTDREGLEARRLELLVNRDAIYQTLKQFDPEIDPTMIGESEGRRRL